jgi:MoaA/NifB/PqqE/SkfB family radical SAM enzyme
MSARDAEGPGLVVIEAARRHDRFHGDHGVSILSEVQRYWNAAHIFRFFIHHPYIYGPVFRDLLEKRLRSCDYTKPRNIVLKLTSRCNARCEFCYAQSETDGDQHELTLEEWKGVINQAQALGCYTVQFSGGEPVLSPHLLELIRYARSKWMLPFTTTNGIALTPARARQLEAAGLCAINFSIHGPEEAHDRVVGVPGAFARLMEHARFCAQQTHIVCIANHVATRESLRHGWPGQIWSRMRALGFRALNLLPICVNSVDKSQLLGEEELREYDALVRDPRIIEDTKNYSRPRCPAAREDLLVNNYGDVQPCPFIPVTFGNVRKEPLATVFLRTQRDPMFAAERRFCMPARDHQFIDEYILPAFRQGKVPVNIDQLRAA